MCKQLKSLSCETEQDKEQGVVGQMLNTQEWVRRVEKSEFRLLGGNIADRVKEYLNET